MRAAALGYGDRVSIDFALLRDLDYYTGFIFEGYLPEIGFPLCGGGRYDSLLPNFGYAVPAVGWSAGVERLLIALERRGKHIARRRHRIDVLVSGADVVADRERAAGNVVRFASSGQDEAALIAEARAHGIPRIVIAENGRFASCASRRRPTSGCPTRAPAQAGRSDAHDRRAEGRALRRFGRAFARAGIDVPDDVGRKLDVVTSDGTQLLFLRPSDVPAYVEFGAADCGIVGKDVLWETDRTRQRTRRSRLRLLPAVRRRAAHRPLSRRRAVSDVLARRDEVRALGRSVFRRARSAGRDRSRCTARSN